MNLLVYIKPVIQYANAILLTIKEIAKSMANLKSQTDDIDYETEFAGFGKSVEEVNEEVEELNASMGELLGFDKLNILGSTSASNLTEGLSVEGRITEALKTYNMNLDKVSFRAKEISERILTWLGFYKTLNKETGEYDWKLSEGNTNLQKIISSLKTIGIVIGSLMLGSKLIGVINSLSTIISSIGSIGSVVAGLSNPITLIVGLIALAVASFIDLYNKNEEFRKSVDETFSTIKNNINVIFGNLKEIYERIKPALDFILNYLKVSFAQSILHIIDKISILSSLLTGDITGALNTIKKMFTDIGDRINEVFGIDINGWFQNNILNNLSWITNWFSKITGWFKDFFNEIGRLWNEYVVSFFKGIWDDYIKPVFDRIAEKFNIIIGLFKMGLDKIAPAFNALWEGLKEGFKAFVNFFIDGINKIISGLNKISFNFPDWIPGIGGKSFGINIPEIPRLAQGGIIEQPTYALMGEYANAQSNPEIVTPENLMREVFVESMLPIAQAIMNGDKEVINAIKDLENRPININGRKVSENIYNDLESVAKRKGKIIFASNI